MRALLTEYLVFAGAAIAIFALIHLLLRRRGRLPRTALLFWPALASLLAAGGWLTAGAERAERRRVEWLLGGIAPTYASEIERLGHARLVPGPGFDRETYLAIIDAQKRWLAVNPTVADIYTCRRDAGGTSRFVVDAETDYDGDGRISGAREERTPVGEEFLRAPPALARAYRGGQHFTPGIYSDRWGSWISAFVPLRDPAGRIEAVLGVDYPAESWVEALDDARYSAMGLVAAAVAALAFFFAAVSLLQLNLRRQREIEATLEARVAERTAELRQAQKMEAVGLLAGGIAHDFNNLLTAIVGNTSLLLARSGDDARFSGHLRQIDDAAHQAASLTAQLLAFSRKQVLSERVLDINRVVGEIAPLLRRLLGPEIEIVEALERGAGSVRADQGQLNQVLMNLAVNARDAMPRGGRLFIETARTTLEPEARGARRDLAPGPYVRLTVRDTGVGMAGEILSRLFEPYFTTKERGKGTGLGLATVHGIVLQSGGGIDVESAPGEGAAFSIYLPRLDLAPEEPGQAPGRAPGPAAGGSETILLLEDERAVLRYAAEVLGSAGYRVLTAACAEEALRVSAATTGPIHLLVADVVLPGGSSGPEAAARIAAQRPGTRVLFVSGYTDNLLADRGVSVAGASFLQKPFEPGALLRAVRDALSPRA